MSDPRVELAQLVDSGSGLDVLQALDSVTVVIEADPGRCQAHADQAGLYNLVNLVGRLFAHVELQLPGSVEARLASLGEDLKGGLDALLSAVAPVPSTEASRQLHISWGRAPSGEGLAADGAGWSYSLGPEHRPLRQDTGPAVGALAAGCFATAQIFALVLGKNGQLGEGGIAAFVTEEGFTANLLDYGLAEAPALPFEPVARLGQAVLLGGGSLGSSTVYAARLLGASGGPIDVVDDDAFKARNRMRYPVLTEVVERPKAPWLAERLRECGIDATGYEAKIDGYLENFEEPPALPLAIVSVDTVEGRRDATDVLARTTLNAGVEGLKLHVARHGFDRERGCAYCQYVDLGPTLSASQMRAERVGLPVDRVIAIELGDGRLSAADAGAIAAAGKVPDPAPVAGDRLADLERRVYAQAAVQATDGGQVLVSAPFVSALAGVAMLAESMKETDERLGDYRLVGRVDFDLSGEPTGAVNSLSADSNRRCLCHSPFRLKAYRELHGLAG